MKTLIIGLGNKILKDDGVGIRAAEALKEHISQRDDIEIMELSVGGMRLMEIMADYRRVFIIDAVMTGNNPPGTIYKLTIDDLGQSLHTSSTHDASLACALEAGRQMGINIPSEIIIWGIEALEVNTFGESMTPALEEAIPAVVGKLLKDLVPAS